jgi:hypothetical protein
MIDINGKSQLEIEQMFSQEQLNEYMAIELAEFVENLKEEHYTQLANHVPKEQVMDTMFRMIAFLGDKNVGHYLESGDRKLEMELVVSYFASFFEESDYNKRMQLAVNLVADFDTILFDLEQKHLMSDKGAWYTETAIIVQFHIGTDTKIAEYQRLVRFRLPMIEQPQQHFEGIAGGYMLNPDKTVTNRGEQEQPQRVLDVLNKLQSNAYTLRNVNYTEERELVMKKLQSDNWKYTNRSDSTLLKENEAKCDVIMMTTHETYTTMANQTFYFPWKFDMRGRMYSTGYDVNLQATKYKKASLCLNH